MLEKVRTVQRGNRQKVENKEHAIQQYDNHIEFSALIKWQSLKPMRQRRGWLQGNEQIRGPAMVMIRSSRLRVLGLGRNSNRFSSTDYGDTEKGNHDQRYENGSDRINVSSRIKSDPSFRSGSGSSVCPQQRHEPIHEWKYWPKAQETNDLCRRRPRSRE